jgi:tripartite ATP-independent transporter DctM subunit
MAQIAGQLLPRVEVAIATVVTFVLIGLLALVTVNVVLRYFLQSGMVGAEDAAVWLHVALIGLGAPIALSGPLAMRLDVLVRHLPRRLEAMARTVGDAFSCCAALVLAGGGGEVIARLGGVSPALGLPEWVRFAFVSAGGSMILMVLLLKRVSEGQVLSALLSLSAGAAAYYLAPELWIETGLPPSIFAAIVAALGIFIGAPLAHAFLAAAFISVAFGGALPEPAIVSTTVAGMSKFLLLAVPFFLLVGSLLTASGVANKLVAFAASIVGHRRAGLAQTTLLTSVLFSGASGSSIANAAFSASTFQPELVKHGYPPAQAGAIVAATSVLDNVIPPSIAFLLLASATNLSVASLLLGGLFAGGLMAVCLAVAIHITAREKATLPTATGRERWRAAMSATPAFGLGLIVVFGIRFGIVTTTEAAALAALYTLCLAIFAKLQPASIFRCFSEAAKESAAIGLLIGSAAPFAFLIALDDAAGLATDFVTMLGGSAIAVIVLANLVLLLVGLLLDIGAAILLFGPILLPSAVAAGIDPVHFGVIVVVNLMIHGLTPPLGILIFVVSGVTGVPTTALFRNILPYLAALLVALALLCALALIY